MIGSVDLYDYLSPFYRAEIDAEAKKHWENSHYLMLGL
jgi:hypothetical protein